MYLIVSIPDLCTLTFISKRNASFIKKNKNLSYSRTKKCIVKRLNVVTSDLYLGLCSHRASGATTTANAPGGLIDDLSAMGDGNQILPKMCILMIQ